MTGATQLSPWPPSWFSMCLQWRLENENKQCAQERPQVHLWLVQCEDQEDKVLCPKSSAAYCILHLTLGSLSNIDWKDNGNVKKAAGISKATTLHVHHAVRVHFFCCTLRQWLGSLSNIDGKGNENGKKAAGISKTTTLHVHHAFRVYFFATARLWRKTS